MVFFEAERMRRWPSYDALKTRLNANIYKNNNNESTATQTPPPTQPLTNEISKISLCISRAALIFLQTRQPLTTTQTQTKYQQCWQCAGKKRNSSEATATYAQSYLLPFRTIVPIKEIMRAKFMAGCKWLLRENGRLSLQGTCHSMPKTFEVPWPCLVRFRVSHQFLVFLQFFPESFLPCLIWCLWPLKKNIFRNELNKQLNASQKTERNMFLMDDNGFEGFVLAFDIFSVERSHVEIAMLHIKKQMMGQSS